MFFLLAVRLLSLGTLSSQVIFHNHMGRRERGKGQQKTDTCALLHLVWPQHFREENQKN